MVLYKRKPVVYQEPPPLPDNQDIKVWFISETKEWFYTYEEYLERMDYYMRRKFVCEITGNSCFTYFEALKSEKVEMKKVEENFPEHLKEPILRYLQFSTITRLDLLVDMVYNQFKNDFYPGESVMVRLQDNKQVARIKEKAKFNAYMDAEGNLRPGYCSYRVSFDDNTEATIDESDISRDRSHFTKWFVKTFIKLSVSRSSKIGAPWIVRDNFAAKYRIPTEYPPHLEAFAPKANDGKKTRKRNGTSSLDSENAKKRANNKVENRKYVPIKIKEGPLKQPSKNEFKKVTLSGLMNMIKDQSPELPAEEINEYELRQKFKNDSVPVSRGRDSGTSTPQPNREISFFGPIPPPASAAKVDQEKSAYLSSFTWPEIAAPRKALIEDLETPMGWFKNQDKSVIEQFHFFEKPAPKDFTLLKGCASEALQTWMFLNVYHHALLLDTFTFDDFVHAMNTKEEGKNLSMVNEVFCAVLSCFILSETEDVNVRLKGYEYFLDDSPSVNGVNNNSINNGTFNQEDSNGKAKNDDDNENETEVVQFPVPTKGKYEDDEFLLITIPQRASYIDDLSSDEESSDEEEEEEEKEEEKEEKEEREIKEIVKKEESGIKIKKPVKEEAKKEENNKIPLVRNANNYGLDFDIYDGLTLAPDPTSDIESEDEYDGKRNNVSKILNYRNISWQERLSRRQFKDGNWQVILLGVISLVSHIKKYRGIVKEINGAFAPKGAAFTPSSIQTRFFDEVPLSLKFKALNVICELVVEGKIIRKYIDNSMEEATRLRRDRLDIIRKYKEVMAKARDLNAECSTILQVWKKDKSHAADVTIPTIDNNNEDNKRRRRNFTLRLEPSQDELALGGANADFQRKLDARSEYIAQADVLRTDKKKVEKKLTELDCARIRHLGKDTYFNRYWWFESNGVPNNNKNSSSIHDGDDKKDEDDADDADAENDEELENETYLMGRLWIQGPSNEDTAYMLNVISQDIENFYKIKEKLENNNSLKNDAKKEDIEMKTNEEEESSRFTKPFIVASSEVFSLECSEDGTVKKNGEVIYRPNQITNNVSAMDRKLIEEAPNPILSSEDWKYYDSSLDVEKLARSLNPWGTREAQLRKNLMIMKEAIDSSITARRKALSLDQVPEEELKLQQEIEKEAHLYANDESGEENEQSIELFEEDEEKEEAPRTRRSLIKNENVQQESTPELVENNEENGPIKRVSKRRQEEEKKAGYREKISRLKNLVHDREFKRCEEWVNSCAIQRLGHLHYDGPPKSKSNSNVVTNGGGNNNKKRKR